MQMKSIVADIRLPSQNIKIQHAQSQPKSIIKIKENLSHDKFGHMPISSTPPNEFMEHLKKRMNGY